MTPKRCKAVCTQRNNRVAAAFAGRRFLFRPVRRGLRARNSPERINQGANREDRDADSGVLREAPEGADGETPAREDEHACRERMSRDADEATFGLAGCV